MSKKLLSCAMAFLMTFSIMPCAAFAEETSVEGQVESLEAEKPAEDDAFGEDGLDEAFFAEDADSLIGTLEANEESAAFAVSANTVIYLDPQHGADENDGLSEATAVKTIEKANKLANEKNINDICLSSFYRVTGEEVWDLGGKIIHRYTGGYMIELKDTSASLTLQNVVIDGARYSVAAENAAETDSIIKAANGGTIVLKSGAILQNNKAAQFGSGILANNGVKITMEKGAVIRNNTNRNYELGGGILLGNGSIFTMNGGEISGNTANGGGGVAIIGSTMVMNGGKISNNSTYQTSGQDSYGAGVYVADYANASGGGTLFTAQPASFEMNGGKITGNTALDYGGGILTFPQQSTNKKITININNGEISGNKVTKGSGGAVAAFFDGTELNIKGGTLTGNSAYQFGGGVFLYQATNVTISNGTISENKAYRGGGVCLYANSAAKQTGGSIENNVAVEGGGVYGGTYTMTGGVIKDNNNSLTDAERLWREGDGVYVGTAFNLGDAAEISTNNDVYLKEGASVAKEGRYINVISSYTGASTARPIQIYSEDVTVEETEIGTQLVRYTTDAGGDTAAAKADANGIFVPSWKMPEGLVIGQSKAAGKIDWMTYVPAVKIQYQWVSTDNPSDVTPPADDYIRTGTAYTAKAQEATHENYTFAGWFTDAACTLSYTDGTVLNTDTILYGKWEKIATPPSSGGGGSHGTKYYILHYESNGGTKYEDEKYKKNTVVILDKIPKRVGYTFTGWYADQELTDKITKIKMTSDKTVYAGWKATDVPETLNSDNHFAYIVGYEDGLVRPNADITRAEVAAIFFRLLKDDVRDSNLTAENAFNDVAFGLWHNKSISTMANIGILKGRTADTFVPNAPITRAEFAAICSRFDQSNVEIKSDFNDISGHWAEKEIRRAASLGWIKGYADGSFKPDQNITRAEAASMINRMLHRLPETVDDLLDGMVQWSDNQPSDWYYINMQEATNSHDFNQKGEIHEHWTKLTANPDWDRYR